MSYQNIKEELNSNIIKKKDSYLEHNRESLRIQLLHAQDVPELSRVERAVASTSTFYQNIKEGLNSNIIIEKKI